MPKIKKIIAREVLDSRGFPTVETEVILDNGCVGRNSVPSGASTGSREALELRDKNARFMGKGVLKAIDHIVHEIAPAIIGTSVFEQSNIDEHLITLDGTPNKERLGANALLGVSLACASAAASAKSEPLYAYIASLTGTELMLPVPLLNIINGGAHADNAIDIQEFMIIPSGASSFAEALRLGVEIYHSLKSLLRQKGLNTNVGDEGGFAPALPSNESALGLIFSAIEQAGLKPGKDIYLGLDVAASEFYENNKYIFENKALTSLQWAQVLTDWAKNYPIISIEDGMGENDWEGWQLLTQALGAKVQLVGDDLFVTNTKIFKEGISKKIANAILIKPNQIGTLSETLAAIAMAKNAQYNAIISHRSGETEDPFIADLAVGTGVGQIKTGAPCRSDRTAKYNQLLRIAQLSSAPFAHNQCYQRWISV